ncbi:hypothetical protein [Skermanella pratensis]|uniref:hypothetical protein n=1 Tax=Skermanella pratensis TaxID=2233999 RepID=UPI00130130D0|nr:hypothetical protein [Skermanella pratensis]
MKIDPKLREDLAQKLYEESDRTGVAWVRRPESVKHAFREAAERKLRSYPDDHAGHGQDRIRQERGKLTVGGGRHTDGPHRGKPVMEPCTR